ncbi:MAG: hypothetical protein GY851_26155 [bacterium]|nr:hypothetical protein [bacterium]
MAVWSQTSKTRRAVGVLALLIAIGLIVGGARVSYEVHDDDEMAAAFGLDTYTEVSERELVIDATFSGVTRRDGKLYSTYDRALGAVKRACPT